MKAGVFLLNYLEMFKITPDKLQELQNRSKKRYTPKYKAAYVAENKKAQARREAKIKKKLISEQKKAARLIRMAQKQAELEAKIQNERRIPKEINWEKVKEYLETA